MPVRCSAHSEPRHYTEFHFDFFGGSWVVADERETFKLEDVACDIGGLFDLRTRRVKPVAPLRRDSPTRTFLGTQRIGTTGMSKQPPAPVGSGRANRGFECVTGRATCAASH